jgi:hypothetical protein
MVMLWKDEGGIETLTRRLNCFGPRQSQLHLSGYNEIVSLEKTRTSNITIF